MKKIVLISTLCLLLDQISKCILEQLLNLNQTKTVIPSFFALTHVRNEGAAWSLFAGRQIFLILISILSVILIYYFFIKNKKINHFDFISYGLLFGGIFGNLWDRILRGYVVDFLDFTIIGYHFPVFNFADICIVIGMFIVIIQVWKDSDNRN